LKSPEHGIWLSQIGNELYECLVIVDTFSKIVAVEQCEFAGNYFVVTQSQNWRNDDVIEL